MKRHPIVLSAFASLLVAAACSSSSDTPDNDDSSNVGGGNGSGGAATSGTEVASSSTTTTNASSTGSGGGGTQGTCDAPTALAAEETVSGDTGAGQDNLTASTAGAFGPCQNGGTKESVFSFEAGASGFVTFTLSSATDQGIFVRSTCDDGDTELACVDGVEGGMDETAGVFVEEGETYFVVVDGYEAGVEGPFSLSAGAIESEAGSCMDATDNNGDGFLFDCHDPTCFDDSGCADAQGTECSDSRPALTPGTPQDGDTSDGTALFGTYDPTCSAMSGGMTQLFAYAPTGESVLLGLTLDSATDQGFFMRTACADVSTQVACRDAVLGNETEFLTVLAEDGVDYTVFVSAYEGGEEGAYTLTSTTFPYGETEPNDQFDVADSVEGGEYCHLTEAEDVDWFAFSLTSAADVTVFSDDVQDGDCAESRIDTEIELFESDGTTSIAFNDDLDEPNSNYCSSLEATNLPAGDYLVRVQSSEMYCPNCTFGYRLQLGIED